MGPAHSAPLSPFLPTPVGASFSIGVHSFNAHFTPSPPLARPFCLPTVQPWIASTWIRGYAFEKWILMHLHTVHSAGSNPARVDKASDREFPQTTTTRFAVGVEPGRFYFVLSLPPLTTDCHDSAVSQGQCKASHQTEGTRRVLRTVRFQHKATRLGRNQR